MEANAGIFANANNMKLFLMVFPRNSLNCKLVSVQYWEYENGLLIHFVSWDVRKDEWQQRKTQPLVDFVMSY